MLSVLGMGYVILLGMGYVICIRYGVCYLY